MNILTKIAVLSLILFLTSACTHMQGSYKQNYSLPIQAIEDSPVKISIINGAPVAILNGEVISRPVKFPHELISDNKKGQGSISIRSIEQFTLIKIKGSCYYFVCAGSTCTIFELPDEFCL